MRTALVHEGWVGDKILTGRSAWSAAVPRSWSCAAWLGHHVPQCHVPGVVPGLLRCHGPAFCPPWSHRWCSPGFHLPNQNSFVPFQRPTLDLPHPQGVPQRCQSCALGLLPAPGPRHPQPCPRWGQTRGCHPAMGTLWQWQMWPWCLSCCRELLGGAGSPGLQCPPLVHVPCRSSETLPGSPASSHSRSPWQPPWCPSWLIPHHKGQHPARRTLCHPQATGRVQGPRGTGGSGAGHRSSRKAPK